MLLRPFLNDATSCASYLFGCGTHAKLAVVDAHAELVDDYLAISKPLSSTSRGERPAQPVAFPADPDTLARLDAFEPLRLRAQCAREIAEHVVSSQPS